MSIIITPPAVLSYPIFTPEQLATAKERARRSGSFDPADVHFGCTLLFPKGTDLSELKKAATAALYERFGEETETMFANGQLRTPFKKVKGSNYDADKYDDYLVVSAKQSAPGFVNRYAGPDGKPEALTDMDKLYPGCLVKAALSIYAYPKKGEKGFGNRGVNFGLQHIQWWAEGTRLDNRVEASNAFSAEERPTADMSGGGAKAPGKNLADLLGE